MNKKLASTGSLLNKNMKNVEKLKILSGALLEKEVLNGEEVKSLLGIQKADLA